MRPAQPFAGGARAIPRPGLRSVPSSVCNRNPFAPGAGVSHPRHFPPSRSLWARQRVRRWTAPTILTGALPSRFCRSGFRDAVEIDCRQAGDCSGPAGPLRRIAWRTAVTFPRLPSVTSGGADPRPSDRQRLPRRHGSCARSGCAPCPPRGSAVADRLRSLFVVDARGGRAGRSEEVERVGMSRGSSPWASAVEHCSVGIQGPSVRPGSL